MKAFLLPPKLRAVKRACALVGGQSNLARLLHVTAPTVNQWVSGKRPVSTERCIAIERITDGQVTRRDLRPDDWHLIWPELAEEPLADKEETPDANHRHH